MASRVWALDADLAAAFDRIDHDHLLAALGSFPARDMIAGWLKAGVFEAGKGSRPPRREPRRAAYAKLNISRLMNSAGLCAALACWPW